ncbi:MAG TPA: glutamate--tRNA ligase family protein, partial [Terriglobales bacterium]|nr:glutamate--tRNA ligase family protein [Terriglobales bacterium]
AHVPMILGGDRARLSKRHGATSVLAYRDIGYLPDALVNYLVRLGWSSGDQEIFSRAELVEKFSLENLGVSAAAFDEEKALWLNFQYLKALPVSDLARLSRPFLEAKGYQLPADASWLEKMVGTLQERANTLADLAEQARFYLSDDLTIDPAAAAKHLTPEIAPALAALRDQLAQVSDWSHDPIRAAFDKVVEQFGLKLGKIAQPVRVAVTGSAASPGIFEVLELLGRDRSLARLDNAIPR